MLKIKELPVMERPYEKLEKFGADTLSDAELLAIIIKCGTKEETSVQIAQRLIKNYMNAKGFYFLDRTDIAELTTIKGIGRVKAIQLKATFELAKRINSNNNVTRIRLTNPNDVLSLVERDLRYKDKEQVRVLTSDVTGYLIKNELVAVGRENVVNLGPKDVFKTAISYSASNVILVHNHPSGDPTPSKADIELTKHLEELGQMFNIALVDHIIIGNGKFVSLREENLFN